MIKDVSAALRSAQHDKRNVVQSVKHTVILSRAEGSRIK